MDLQLLIKILFGTLVTTVITDLIFNAAKKAPRFFLAPYLRLGKETAFLLGIVRNNDFSQWRPRAARYVALHAIKAKEEAAGSVQPALDLLKSFLNRREPVVVLGEPGAGKTTALQALTYRLARRALLFDFFIWLALLIFAAALYFTTPAVIIVIQGISFATPMIAIGWLASFILWEPLVRRPPVPLFIEARSDYPGGDVNQWCENNFKARLGAKPIIGSHRRAALLIDGVNEIEASLFGVFVEGWRGRLRDKRGQVVFTSRGGEENPAESLDVKNVLSVCDLDDDGVFEFLKFYGRERAAKENRPYCAEQSKCDFDELQKKNLLAEGSIGRNPYWLKMIAESGLYTINRGALFQGFCKTLISREIEKPKKRERGLVEWRTVPLEVEIEGLAALALAMHEEKRVGFSEKAGWEKAWETIEESLRHSPYKPQDVLSEAQAATLLRVQFKTRVEFVHQLVQEFFAAYALHPESEWQKALRHCEDVWWWQTLFHMGGLVGENSAQAFIELVHKVLGDGSNEQRVFVAIGLLRSVENVPSEVSSAVIGAFGGLMDKNMNLVWPGATTLKMTDTQLLALRELTHTLGEEAAEAFAMLVEDPRIEIKIIGILILSILGTRRAAELIVKKMDDSIRGFVGITPLAQMGASAVEPLIAALKNQDINVRRLAAEALGHIGDAQAIEPLIAALRDQNGDVRSFAAGALGQTGDARAVAPLIAALRDENEGVGHSAARALVKIGAPSVEPLIAALFDENSVTRRLAVTALGDLADARAVEPNVEVPGLNITIDFPLAVALRDDDKDVRRSAEDALVKIGSPSVQLLIAALRDSDERARQRAAMALGRIGDARAVEPLISALSDSNMYVRQHAVRALESIGDTHCVEPLVITLRDPNDEVRKRAAVALRKIGAPSVDPLVAVLRDEKIGRIAGSVLAKIGTPSVEPLVAALQHENQVVRVNAANALGRIGDARAVEPLIAALRDERSLVGMFAAQALGRIGNAQAVEPLVAALRDSNTGGTVEDALTNIGAPSVEPLIAVFADQEKDAGERARDALVRIGTPSLEPLIAALRAENENVAASAAYVLGDLKDARAVEPLIAALGNNNENLREKAARALGRIGDARATEPLTVALQDQSEAVRISAAWALINLGDERTVEPLVAALQDESEGVRRGAALTLARICDKRAVNPLIAALRDRSEDVRWCAAGALGQFRDARAVKPLMAALQDESESSHDDWEHSLWSLTRNLIQIGAPCVEPLIAALQDKSERVRRFAAHALGRIGDTRAVEPLIASLANENADIRWSVATALGELGDARSLSELERMAQVDDKRSRWGKVADAAQNAVEKIGRSQKIETYRANLRDEDKDVRKSAVEALAQLQDARSVEVLIAALGDEDRDLCEGAASTLVKIGEASVQPLIDALGDTRRTSARWRTVRALGQIRDRGAVEPLISLLRDEWPVVRQLAAEGLGQIRDRRAVEPLIAALGDGNRETRGRAALALGRMADIKAIGPLIATLGDDDGNVRVFAADALVQIGASSVQPLIAALREENEDACEGATYALTGIGAPSIEPLIAAVQDESERVRAFAADALIRIGARSVEPLITALKDGKTKMRWLVAEVLGRIGDARATDPLISALRDESADVRSGAADALGGTGDARAVWPLVAARRDKDENVRWGAVWALGKIGDTRSIDTLIAALEDEYVNVRWSAAEALGRMQDSRAVDRLIDALYDDSENVCQQAAMALGKIGDVRALDELERVAKLGKGNATDVALQAANRIRQRQKEE